MCPAKFKCRYNPLSLGDLTKLRYHFEKTHPRHGSKSSEGPMSTLSRSLRSGSKISGYFTFPEAASLLSYASD